MSRVWKFIFSFLLFVGACYVGLTWFVNSEVEKGLNNSIAEISGLSLAYSDISVSIVNHTVSLTKVEATLPQGQHLTADEVTITSFDQINPIPHYIIANATGVVFDATPANVGEWADTLHAFDISAIKGNVSLDYRYIPDTMTLALNTLTIKAPELGDIEITGSIDKLDLHLLRMEELIGLRMGDVDFTFTNHSLIDTMIQASARGLNVSETDALAQISAELTAMADYAGNDENSLAEGALRGFKRYINDPGSITIKARPVDPIPFLYFFMGRDLYDNLRMMNVEVETNSSEDI